MSEDLLRRLRAADPALHVVDLAADDVMREAIMTTDGTATREARAPRARRVRRGVLAVGLATVLVGGGAAYATFSTWYRGGGVDGVTCLARWDAPEDERSGGPLLTGDPLVDCARYQELTGQPTIDDPVAFRIDGVEYVAPRGEVPDGAEPVVTTPEDLVLRELWTSVYDVVDGIGGQCLDEAGAVAAARAELDRLGLGDWQVRVVPRTEGDRWEDCADVVPAVDVIGGEVFGRIAGVSHDALVTAVTPEPVPDDAFEGEAVPLELQWVPRTVDVLPHGRPAFADQADVSLLGLRDTLRTQIAEACVDLDEAERLVGAALGVEHHWPTAVIEDSAAVCTRVDLVVGGSVQVTLRGPRA